jgi:UDP-N-acetylglucosamine--N-acetylmuramyl-(pentapeptide) pyrophosphoryl-undecaprenol N-acetylglucosamine transferase
VVIEGERKPRCLIAAGGTVGHLAPSLAVAEALRARGVEVTFAGSPDRVEARLVPEAGFAFDAFEVDGFPRRPGWRLVRALARASVAPFAAARILRRRRPDVVLGGGGYVAGPVVAAARVLGIPAALMEADAHLGLANRLAVPLARRVFLAYPIRGREGPKYEVAGRPIPSWSRAGDGGEARRRLLGERAAPVVLIFGGSQGARRLNEAALDAFAEVGPTILHVSGERDYEELSRRPRRDGYVLEPFLADFGEALAAADLVVARAGGSVWEVAAAGKPALLVPFPHATADHQTKNARYFVEAGGAVLVPEQEIDLRRQVEALLGDPQRLRAMGEAMRAVARPDAAETIADELVGLATA